MKTIEEIWRDGGEKFPFEVKYFEWSEERFFHIVARAPKGRWIGWHQSGEADSWDGVEADWLPYTPPKQKQKMKFLAYISCDGDLCLRKTCMHPDPLWKRVPSEDKLIEVEGE